MQEGYIYLVLYMLSFSLTIVGGWGMPEDIYYHQRQDIKPLLACDLDVAPGVSHLILCPAAEVGQLRVAQLLDGQLVDVALPPVHVALVMSDLLLPPPGQVIPGDLRDMTLSWSRHVTLTMGSGYPCTLHASSVVTPTPEYTRKLRGRTSGKSENPRILQSG